MATIRKLLVPPAVPALTSDPETASAANEGAIYFNLTSGKLRYSDGSRWVELPTSGGGGSKTFAFFAG